MSSVIADFKLPNGEWAYSLVVDGKKKHTVGGRYYNDMKKRCLAGGYIQKVKPSYVGCTHSFKSVSDFIDWARSQIGYGAGQLDKDLLVKGNKRYSPETCVFVPQHINSLLTTSLASRGPHPIGVSTFKRTGLFRASCKIDGKLTHLGQFNSAGEAFTAYKAAKEAEIKRCAELYRLDLDPRAYDALMQYTVDIND